MRALGAPRSPRARADQLLRGTCLRTIGQHEEAERLAVRSTRRTRRGEEDRAQHLRWNRLVAVSPNRACRRQSFEQSDGVAWQGRRVKVVVRHGISLAQ